jgi:lysophospholipid acyltransferase (LPLAT)-like uncharacterized protein
MRQQIIFFLIQRIIFPVIRLLFRSQRIEIEGLDHFKDAASKGPLLLSLWHENLLIIPYLLANELSQISVSAVTSKSKDGELLESLKKTLPNVETIRVKHDARHGSLKSILSALKKGKVVIITPDGPQGPWKQLKPGLIRTSTWTTTPIWCLNWSCSKTLRLSTQDRMKLPWPFQKITIRFQEAGIYQERTEEMESKIRSLLD